MTCKELWINIRQRLDKGRKKTLKLLKFNILVFDV